MDKAVELYQEAIALFCDMGRFANAAKLEKEIGEMYESNNDSEKCVKHFQKAADYFMGEDSSAAANQCLLKVAHFNALMLRRSTSRLRRRAWRRTCSSSMRRDIFSARVSSIWCRECVCVLEVIVRILWLCASR